MRSIDISGRKIGPQHPCFIIAEAGANFRISNDPKINFEQALKLIEIAAQSGADAVKFQLYRAKTLYVEEAGFADYLGNKKSIFDIIREMELPASWLSDLKQICDDNGIVFLCTPFDEKAVDDLEKIDVPAYKIASYTVTHIPLLEYVAKTGKPIILSTGASELKDIEEAVGAIKAQGNNQVVLMQCTAKYPAPIDTVHLKTMNTLKEKFSLPVGLSDHSRHPLVGPMGAVALGGCVVEKHFTTDNRLPGPDHGFAILPDELAAMVEHIRLMERALGNPDKNVLEMEQELHEFARRSIYAAKDIEKGEIITENDIIILRSGKKAKGLPPKYKDRIIGKKTKKKIIKQSPIDRYNVQL
jgi:N,N'-diacetyllegionaminate synthase